MAFGLDYEFGPPIANMKAAGVTFVCRYLSEVNNLTRVKLLTPNEAKMLKEAGIAIVSNYEWYANRALESFASGVQDAQTAARQHAACGGPADRPIYFSVDVDVAGERTAGYFHGIASVLGVARTGAYGSFRVLHYLFNAGLIDWGWQTYAWSYGAWEPRAHIQQYHNSMTLAGASVDYNRSMKSDYGQWGIAPVAKGSEIMAIAPDDPIIQKYFTYANGQLTRKDTGATMGRGVTAFYLKNGGPALLRLNISGEIPAVDAHGQPIPGVVYVFMEGGVIAFDPKDPHTGKRKLDNPPTDEDCYFLHIDKGPGQQLVAHPLLVPLQQEVTTLQQQLQAEMQKVAPPDPVVQHQLDTYKSAVQQAATQLNALLASSVGGTA